MNRFEHAFKVPVQFVLFFFGLVNAGVPFGSVGGGTWIVLIATARRQADRDPVADVHRCPAGAAHPRRPARTVTLLVVGVTAGIGFTVALFFTTAAFPPGAALDEAKMGALLSFVAAPIAILVGQDAFASAPPVNRHSMGSLSYDHPGETSRGRQLGRALSRRA